MIHFDTRLLLFIGLFLLSSCNGSNNSKQKDSDAEKSDTLKVIKDTIGNISTMKPVTQSRDAATYDWDTRHKAILALNEERPPKIVFIGNSILHYWGGEPKDGPARGADSWDQYFKPKDVRNLGFGYDRIENALWRVHHGELDGYTASHIVVLIGTNNIMMNTDTQIIKGLEFLLEAIKRHQPTAKIILMSILPRQYFEPRLAIINDRIEELASKMKVEYADAEPMFLGDDGMIEESLFDDDLVHPNAKGYRLLAPFIDKYLD